jgi:hypothetical protein
MCRVSRSWVAVSVALALAATTAVVPAVAKRKGGCGRFCRQAGAVGGAPGDPGVTIRGADRSLRLRRGVVAVRVSCRRTTTCVGAVQINPVYFDLPGGVPPGSYNGVDLTVPAGRTASFEIPLLPAAAQLVRERGHLLVDAEVRLEDNRATRVDRRMTLSPAAAPTSAR